MHRKTKEEGGTPPLLCYLPYMIRIWYTKSNISIFLMCRILSHKKGVFTYMDSDLTLDFIIIIILIIANGLFSMTELAIVNAKNAVSKRWVKQVMNGLKSL